MIKNGQSSETGNIGYTHTKKQAVGTVPKSNGKITERDKIDRLTHTYRDRSLSCLGKGISINVAG